MTYKCPVCGYDGLTKPPTNNRICPCCGTEFESDDFDRSYQELRGEWIDKDMPWFSSSTLQPKAWSPIHQLIIADFETDMVSHQRFRNDIEFRHAVNKAFSEVRIAKQLKILREDRNLTQSQLAEKATMKQSRISALEGMDYSSWSISTLERLAKALGVSFEYSFSSWNELVDEIGKGLRRDSLRVPTFNEERAFASAGLIGVGTSQSVINRMFAPALPSITQQSSADLVQFPRRQGNESRMDENEVAKLTPRKATG